MIREAAESDEAFIDRLTEKFPLGDDNYWWALHCGHPCIMKWQKNQTGTTRFRWYLYFRMLEGVRHDEQIGDNFSTELFTDVPENNTAEFMYAQYLFGR